MNENNHRRRRRRGQNKCTSLSSPRVPNYRQLRHAFPPQSIFTLDEVQNIHETALRVLQELGIKVLLPEARDLFAKAGARIHDQMVFIGRDIVEAALHTAPTSIKLRAANAKREQIYENGSMIFAPAGGCPNANDRRRGRRPGSLESHRETLKLVQSFDVMHTFGPTVEPQDVPIHLRHYAMMQAQLELGDKPLHIFSRGHQQVQQSFEMIQLGLRLSDDDFIDGAWAYTVINSNSPRMLDQPMAQGLIDFARSGQLSIITPFCLAGAMVPVTVAGALTLQHAEALCGITLAQLAKPGAPISYGGFSSNVDMKSGSPSFGTPEHVKMQIGAGQLARSIGLPWRSAAGAASNVADMQAATENTMAVWGSCMANATLTIHSAGWLEGGLTFGYEKFINDIESLQRIAELSLKPNATDAEIGFDALADVQPGGHFFATQHTMDRYATAFYSPLVADLSNFENWQDNGSKTATERATDIWQQVLMDYTPPLTGGEAMVEKLAPTIERHTKNGGAPPME